MWLLCVEEEDVADEDVADKDVADEDAAEEDVAEEDVAEEDVAPAENCAADAASAADAPPTTLLVPTISTTMGGPFDGETGPPMVVEIARRTAPLEGPPRRPLLCDGG